jgi:transcriptional regulator with XRE-family HTH domain
MRLTPFGEEVRILRVRLGLSLKDMAVFLGISSSHLSGIEYGEKRLSQKYVDSTVLFFRGKASADQIAVLRKAAEKSKDIVHTTALSPKGKYLVAAFARRLEEGAEPPEEMQAWIDEKTRPKTASKGRRARR